MWCECRVNPKQTTRSVLTLCLARGGGFRGKNATFAGRIDGAGGEARRRATAG